jgi:hypothetical protein
MVVMGDMTNFECWTKSGHSVTWIVPQFYCMIRASYLLPGLTGFIFRTEMRRYHSDSLVGGTGITEIGQPINIGQGWSQAYAAPEMARRKWCHNGLEVALPSLDVWSLGVVFFELCAGLNLFVQDVSNDNMVDKGDMCRLCVWNTITDEQLEPVFAVDDDQPGMRAKSSSKASFAPPTLVQDAKQLIRWMLRGNPKSRPTIQQILCHRFFAAYDDSGKFIDPDEAALRDNAAPPQRMHFHAFMSHCQADASGTVAALYEFYVDRGVFNWYDMRQPTITLEGMKQGVRNSDCFLLFLSEHVLGQWYCQQEILEALKSKKRVQLVLEVDDRFNPFPLAAWLRMRQNEGGVALPRKIVNSSKKTVEVPAEIVQMIDMNLAQAVKYRRRDFEVESMMDVLCSRNGLELPGMTEKRLLSGTDTAHMRQRKHTGTWHAPTHQIFIICEDTLRSSSSPMLAKLEADIAAVDGLVVTPDIQDADRFLLVLSGGVLSEGSASMTQLKFAIERDAVEWATENIVAVFDDTWKFGCTEQLASHDDIQSCLANHEATVRRHIVMVLVLDISND